MKDNDINWVAILAAVLLCVGAAVGVLGCCLENWFIMAAGVVVEVLGLGWAVLALGDR